MASLARRRMVIMAALLTLGSAALPATALAQTEIGRQQRLVDEARLVLDAFLDDPQYQNMRVYVQNAYAIVVVPDLLEAGFLLGFEHGVGIMLARNPETGGWGQPAFYDVYGGSLGLQFGGKSSDVVFTVMNKAAVQRLASSGLKLGADADVALGRTGAGIGAATTTRFGEDLYIFAKSQGLFGGFAVDGTYLSTKSDWNRSYYGRDVSPEEVLLDFNSVLGTSVASLHETLTRF